MPGEAHIKSAHSGSTSANSVDPEGHSHVPSCVSQKGLTGLQIPMVKFAVGKTRLTLQRIYDTSITRHEKFSLTKDVCTEGAAAFFVNDGDGHIGTSIPPPAAAVIASEMNLDSITNAEASQRECTCRRSKSK